MKALDDLIRVVLADDLRLRLGRKPERMGWTAPSEIARRVLEDRQLAHYIALLPREDPFDLRGIVHRFVRDRVAAAMRSMHDEWGIRRYETLRIAGQAEARWLPVRGMTLAHLFSAGQEKMGQGRLLWREGRMLVLLGQVAQERGYALDDYIRAGYEEIAAEAGLRLEREDEAVA